MNYFTADWHLGDDRVVNEINLLMRNKTSYGQWVNIKNNLLELKEGDTLWHLGDVLYSEDREGDLRVISNQLVTQKVTFNLIVGNYDEKKLNILERYFDNIYTDYYLVLGDRNFYLNHYPIECRDKEFSITGHIHSLWKVQERMINVGVDCWWYKPVSEKEILWLRNAMEKHYDDNVFIKK